MIDFMKYIPSLFFSAKSQAPIKINKIGPQFSQRLPKKVVPETDLFINLAGTEGTLISPKANILIHDKDLKPGIYSSESHPELDLKWPVIIGDNGRKIAILKDDAKRIGKGSFGTVYWGIDIDTNQQVAVKFQNFKDDETRNDIRDEVTRMKELDRLITSIEVDNTIIAVDEFSHGVTYEAFIEDYSGRNETEEVSYKIDMAIKFLKEVNEIHKRGYLHRDIKLDNMMWDPETQKAKIIDFGFVIKIADVLGKQLDDVGTDIYEPAESISGQYSIATDIYACGVSLIDIFSTNDIFDNVNDWLNIRNDQQFLLMLDKDAHLENPHSIDAVNKSSTVRYFDYIKKSAPDLFKQNSRSGMKPLATLIESMLDLSSGKQPSLEQAIARLEEMNRKLKAKSNQDYFVQTKNPKHKKRGKGKSNK